MACSIAQFLFQNYSTLSGLLMSMAHYFLQARKELRHKRLLAASHPCLRVYDKKPGADGMTHHAYRPYISAMM